MAKDKNMVDFNSLPPDVRDMILRGLQDPMIINLSTGVMSYGGKTAQFDKKSLIAEFHEALVCLAKEKKDKGFTHKKAIKFGSPLLTKAEVCQVLKNLVAGGRLKMSRKWFRRRYKSV
jgi:hypothetical protein